MPLISQNKEKDSPWQEKIRHATPKKIRHGKSPLRKGGLQRIFLANYLVFFE